MLLSKNTNCKDCENIANLLFNIDCAIFSISRNMYNNTAFLLGKKVDRSRLSSLLHYKRILTYKLYNPEYVCKFSLESILSEVKKLTLGCTKECECIGYEFSEPDFSSFPTTTTSTTTVVPTTTTTTTIPELLLTFYTQTLNYNPTTSTALQFEGSTENGFPYQYTFGEGGEIQEIPYNPAYTLNQAGFEAIENDVATLISSQTNVVDFQVIYPVDWVYDIRDLLYKWVISISPGETFTFTFRNGGHATGVLYKYNIILSEDGSTVTTQWLSNFMNFGGDMSQFQILAATAQFYDKDQIQLLSNDETLPIIRFIE